MPAKREVEDVITRFRYAYDMAVVESRGDALVGVMQICRELHTAGHRLPLTYQDTCRGRLALSYEVDGVLMCQRAGKGYPCMCQRPGKCVADCFDRRCPCSGSFGTDHTVEASGIAVSSERARFPSSRPFRGEGS